MIAVITFFIRLNDTIKLEKRIARFYAEDKIFYQDNEVGEIVRNYLIWCGKEG